jgi:hypothetical protein
MRLWLRSWSGNHKDLFLALERMIEFERLQIDLQYSIHYWYDCENCREESRGIAGKYCLDLDANIYNKRAFYCDVCFERKVVECELCDIPFADSKDCYEDYCPDCWNTAYRLITTSTFFGTGPSIPSVLSEGQKLVEQKRKQNQQKRKQISDIAEDLQKRVALTLTVDLDLAKLDEIQNQIFVLKKLLHNWIDDAPYIKPPKKSNNLSSGA